MSLGAVVAARLTAIRGNGEIRCQVNSQIADKAAVHFGRFNGRGQPEADTAIVASGSIQLLPHNLIEAFP